MIFVTEGTVWQITREAEGVAEVLSWKDSGAVLWLSSSRALAWLLLALAYKARAWRFEIIWTCCSWKKKPQNIAFLSHLCFPIFLSIILLKEIATLFSKMDKLNIWSYRYFIGFVGCFGWLFNIWTCNLIVTIGFAMGILRTFVKYYFFHPFCILRCFFSSTSKSWISASDDLLSSNIIQKHSSILKIFLLNLNISNLFS